jgi:hypothetical protein
LEKQAVATLRVYTLFSLQDVHCQLPAGKHWDILKTCLSIAASSFLLVMLLEGPTRPFLLKVDAMKIP